MMLDISRYGRDTPVGVEEVRYPGAMVRYLDEKSLVVRRGDYEVTPGTSQAHSHKSTCCVPRSTYVPTTRALASHYWSQVDTIGQPNHVWEGMRQMGLHCNDRPLVPQNGRCSNFLVLSFSANYFSNIFFYVSF